MKFSGNFTTTYEQIHFIEYIHINQCTVLTSVYILAKSTVPN